MNKASEYRQHAHECRKLAAGMESADQRALMLQMAKHWEKLAADRAELITRHPELAHEGSAMRNGASPRSSPNRHRLME